MTARGRAKKQTPVLYSFDELLKLADEYLASLDGDAPDERYCSDRRFAQIGTEGFLSWLKRRERRLRKHDPAALRSPRVESDVYDRNGVLVCPGDWLSEAGGYVQGRVRFDAGALRVHLYVAGNLAGEHRAVRGVTGWGSRPHAHDLGDYLVADRVAADNDEPAVVTTTPHTCEKCEALWD